MTALPFYKLLLVFIVQVLLGYASQRAWFFFTRAWWRRRGLPLHFHTVFFFLLLLASAWVLASHSYHRPAMLKWLYGWSAVYLVSSSVSGVMLAALYAVEAMRRHLRRGPGETVKTPSVAVAAVPIAAIPRRSRAVGLAEAPLSVERRSLLRWAGTAVLTVPWAAFAYGYAVERTDVRLTHVPLRLGPVARPWRGLRLALISDIHLDDYFSLAHLRQVVRRINRLRPDLVAITGDFITYRRSISDVISALAGLRARLGIFGCLGNHEIDERAQRLITAACAGIGIEILRFQARQLRRPGKRLNLLGVDFLQAGEEEDVRGLRPLVRPHELNILLSHNPNVFPYLDGMPIQLTLAGHLHGGQIVFPGLPALSPARLVSPYLGGLYHRHGHWMYVTRGLGTVGVPIRLGAPPEITLLELV